MLDGVGTPVDRQCVGAGRVGDLTDVGIADGGVDNLGVLSLLVAQCVDLLLPFLLQVFAADQRGDVAAEGEDAQHLARIVVDGHQAELGYHVVADGLGGLVSVHVFQILHVDVEHRMDVNALLNGFLGIVSKDVAGLGVDVDEPAVLVEEDDAQNRGVEDGPVAQRALFVEPLLLLFLRHVLLGADNDGGVALLVTAQYGQHDVVVAVGGVAARSRALYPFHVLGTQVQLYLFLFLFLVGLPDFSEFVQGQLQTDEILAAVSLREFLHRVRVGHLSVIVMPGELVRLDVVGPDFYLTGLHNQRQAIVALDVLESYLPVLDTVADAIDGHEDE